VISEQSEETPGCKRQTPNWPRAKVDESANAPADGMVREKPGSSVQSQSQFYPASSINPLVDSDPAVAGQEDSSGGHPASSIQHPASSIQHRASSIAIQLAGMMSAY
jgi:hypothetical protein